MKEDIAERLIQSAATLIEQNVENNLEIRKFLAMKETITAILVRFDAFAGAVKGLEKGVQLDENKLRQLEEQSENLKASLEVFKENAKALKDEFKGLEDQVKKLAELIEGVDRKINAWRDELNHIRMEEAKRWEIVGGLIAKLRWWAPVIGIILAVTVLVLAGLFIWLANR